jgi:hypothetical protein
VVDDLFLVLQQPHNKTNTEIRLTAGRQGQAQAKAENKKIQNKTKQEKGYGPAANLQRR